MEKQKVIYRDLGQMNYQAAWDLQESLLKENVRRKSDKEGGEPTEHYLLLWSIRQFIRLERAGIRRMC